MTVPQHTKKKRCNICLNDFDALSPAAPAVWQLTQFEIIIRPAPLFRYTICGVTGKKNARLIFFLPLLLAHSPSIVLASAFYGDNGFVDCAFVSPFSHSISFHIINLSTNAWNMWLLKNGVRFIRVWKLGPTIFSLLCSFFTTQSDIRGPFSCSWTK